MALKAFTRAMTEAKAGAQGEPQTRDFVRWTGRSFAAFGAVAYDEPL